jgi:hypothetical protein
LDVAQVAGRGSQAAPGVEDLFTDSTSVDVTVVLAVQEDPFGEMEWLFQEMAQAEVQMFPKIALNVPRMLLNVP